MKGRRRILTWTFLFMLLFVQTAFVGTQEKIFLQVIPKGLKQQTGEREQTLTQKKAKLLFQIVKKGKTTTSSWKQQPIWQQTGGKREGNEDCGYRIREYRRPGRKATGAMQSGLRAPPKKQDITERLTEQKRSTNV